ncbi:hypothetical protein C7N43_21225 [Sphingobacteriales bacterium UPWRP_1]|nr:hypothetical protein BVG80_16100 [Sphingobacteriales bacterium TSM_CSM]PSJ74996.1 hypothetical protein C7N43_21225 [Sphingobacteriales bacterium UPWRP_1]
MKTYSIQIFLLSFFLLVSLGIQAQPMSINGRTGNNGSNSDAKMPMTINGPKNNAQQAEMPMSINSPKASALHGFFQVGDKAVKLSLQTGNNTLQIPGVQAKYNVTITEDFNIRDLIELMRNTPTPITFTPTTTPESYTDPGSAHFYALSVPTADGTVVKGILAIGIGETNPFAKLPDPLPYWW